MLISVGAGEKKHPQQHEYMMVVWRPKAGIVPCVTLAFPLISSVDFHDKPSTGPGLQDLMSETAAQVCSSWHARDLVFSGLLVSV